MEVIKPVEASPGEASSASMANLAQLFEADWQWELLDNPEFASQAGAHDVKWPAGLFISFAIACLFSYLKV